MENYDGFFGNLKEKVEGKIFKYEVGDEVEVNNHLTDYGEVLGREFVLFNPLKDVWFPSRVYGVGLKAKPFVGEEDSTWAKVYFKQNDLKIKSEEPSLLAQTLMSI